MKKLFLLLTIIVMVVSLCACSEGGLTTVSVSEVAHSVFYAPQYAAIKLGYFEEEGLTIDLINGQGADKVMTAVLSDQVDIGFSGPEAAIYVYNEGKEDYPRVFAQMTKRDGAFIVGREPNENFSIEDLKGKYIIGGRKGGVPEMTLEYVIKNAGLSLNELEIDTGIQFANMGGAFTGGLGDYVALFEPTASALEQEGKGYVLASIGELSGEIPYTAYYAKASYIKENPEIIQGFTNAIYKGQQWVRSASAKEIAEAIADFFPDTDVEILKKVAERYKTIDAWNSDPILTEDSLSRLQDVMEEAGELDARAPYEAIVDTSFAENAVIK